jgi:hypothetical protein
VASWKSLIKRAGSGSVNQVSRVRIKGSGSVPKCHKIRNTACYLYVCSPVQCPGGTTWVARRTSGRWVCSSTLSSAASCPLTTKTSLPSTGTVIPIKYYTIPQCCGTVTNVTVPVPVPAPYLDHKKQIFQKKCWKTFCLFT